MGGGLLRLLRVQGAETTRFCAPRCRSDVGTIHSGATVPGRKVATQQPLPTHPRLPLSTPQVFGPHCAALFGTHAAWERAGPGPNFFFVPKEQARAAVVTCFLAAPRGCYELISDRRSRVSKAGSLLVVSPLLCAGAVQV